MATRGGGPTASGTDGNDYSHRETIVEQYYIRPPPKSQPKGMGYNDDINNDPGVHEPEDQHAPKSPLRYPDTKDFIAQFMRTPEQPNPTYPLPPQQPSQPLIQSPPAVSLNTSRSYNDNATNPINVPNGMVMVPANQMMMLAPQWMFAQQGNQPSQQLGASIPSNSLPVTPVPTPEPPPIPEPTPSDTNKPSDYKGLGGPDSVPFRMPKNETAPCATSPKKSLIDELYLAPTTDVRERSNRTIMNTEIAQTKSRLKWSLLFHYVLGFILLAKLVPDILDRFGIFVLEIEELLIPKAKLWEMFWILSIPATFLGLLSSKKSNASMMTKFFYGIFVLGLFPVLVGFVVNFPELYTFASTKDTEMVETWNGFPVSVLWYVYLFLALQAHLFELYFAKTLIKVWQPRKKKTQ